MWPLTRNCNERKSPQQQNKQERTLGSYLKLIFPKKLLLLEARWLLFCSCRRPSLSIHPSAVVGQRLRRFQRRSEWEARKRIWSCKLQHNPAKEHHPFTTTLSATVIEGVQQQQQQKEVASKRPTKEHYAPHCVNYITPPPKKVVTGGHWALQDCTNSRERIISKGQFFLLLCFWNRGRVSRKKSMNIFRWIWK